MKRVTVDAIMERDPCSEYTRERVEELWDGRESLSALDILSLDIPAADQLWAVLHPSLIDESDLHELGCRFASRALRRERKAGREPDERSWEAVRVKRRWIRGKATDEELAAARAAAWSAWAAAWSTASSSSAASVASVAESKWQAQCVKRLLERRG